MLPKAWPLFLVAGGMYVGAILCFVAWEVMPGDQVGLVVASEVLAAVPTFWLIVRRRWPWVP